MRSCRGRCLPPCWSAARNAADRLNAQFPEGWERSKNESWREIRYCRHPAFMTLVRQVLDPLALEILESAPPVDLRQLAATFPGFATKGGVGRNFHIDMGQQPALDVFNVLQGVALTDVGSDTAGSFHVLPRSHEQFAELVPAAADGCCRALGRGQARGPEEIPQPAHGGAAREGRRHHRRPQLPGARHFGQHDRHSGATCSSSGAPPARSRIPRPRPTRRQAFMRNPWLYFRQ